MTTLKRNTPPRRFSVRFCPYCGLQNLKTTPIHHSNKEHRFCETCQVYFIVEDDWFNDFPENNEEDTLNSDCTFIFTPKRG